MAEEGVDLIALEMCGRLDHSALITEAVVATGLPVWLGMSCQRDAETGDLTGFDQPEVDLAQSVAALAQTGVGVFNIMHTSVADTAAALALVKEHWSGPIGALKAAFA